MKKTETCKVFKRKHKSTNVVKPVLKCL